MVFIRIAKPVSFFSHLVAVSVRLGVCLLAVAMLLSFPALRSHSFVIHFRSPEVRRSVAQHNPLSPMHGQAKLQLARSEIEPVLAIRAQPRPPEHSREAEVPARASIVETLHRLKLGPHRDADSEPHL